jgi:hypothetical protein
VEGVEGKEARGGQDPQEVQGRWRDLLHEIRRVQQFEDYELTGDGRITIGVGYFKQLVTAHLTLLTLQAEGVDNWEGYAEAMSEPLGDEWLREL